VLADHRAHWRGDPSKSINAARICARVSCYGMRANMRRARPLFQKHYDDALRIECGRSYRSTIECPNRGDANGILEDIVAWRLVVHGRECMPPND
jgi:murein endopeptidase